jgi:arsenite methyltransferase
MDATRAAYLRERVEQVYSSIATTPQARHPFVTGRTLAANVGYPQHKLDQLPATASASFAGVAAVGCFAQIAPGATVLDLGCGAGLDSLLAAQQTGVMGQVIGIDFSTEMVQRAQQNATARGMTNLSALCGDAERLPLADQSIDTSLINGIFNLNPARPAIFAELARVMRPGGAVYAAEIVLRHPLAPAVVAQETNWFA